MAQRPVFCPQLTGPALVREQIVEFTWYAGFVRSQAQKSIQSLHAAAIRLGIDPILEISSKSLQELGIRLSAFNLLLEYPPYGRISVESAYQGSKVFVGGKQYRDIYSLPPRAAKTDTRIRGAGDLIAFEFGGERWPLEPPTAFYDWLYINALRQNPELSRQLSQYRGFSDIAFNPERSINCQARAAACYVALEARELLQDALSAQERFITLLRNAQQDTQALEDMSRRAEQQTLFDAESA